VVGNLTVTAPTGAGWLDVVAKPVGPPTTSSINYAAGQTIANGLTVGVDPAAGSVSFWSNHATYVIFDVTAVYAPSARYVPGALSQGAVSPARMRAAHARMVARTSAQR
jgi:hypothetical protein